MAKISAVTKMLKIANRTLLSLREAAKLYNVSVNTLSRHAKIGTLPTQRVTGFRVVFVDTEDLERWMQEHYQQKRAQRARQWWANLPVAAPAGRKTAVEYQANLLGRSPPLWWQPTVRRLETTDEAQSQKKTSRWLTPSVPRAQRAPTALPIGAGAVGWV